MHIVECSIAMSTFLRSSMKQLIAGKPVDTAIGINNLRLGNSDVLNQLLFEMKVSTKPVMKDY